MNLRKENLAELIIKNLHTVSIKDNNILLLTLPNGLSTTYVNHIGESIVKALNAIGKDNPVILIPEGFTIDQINEEYMIQLGWRRNAKFKQRNTNDTRDNRSVSSEKQPTDKSTIRELWESTISHITRKQGPSNTTNDNTYYNFSD